MKQVTCISGTSCQRQSGADIATAFALAGAIWSLVIAVSFIV